MEKIVLIDGHSILNRAYYGIPELTNSEGLHTNAVYGFLNILFKILEEEQPQYLAVAFDLKAPTFRHKMFADYKGTRKPMPEELHQQVPVIKSVLQAMDILTIEKEGYEADDVLGTIAKKSESEGLTVSVVSGDRDLLQLATSVIKIRIPKTKRNGTEVEDYLEEQVLEKYQVTPLQFIDVKALMGDASDNIPGVPGIGEKTATKLIVQHNSLEGVYEHIDEMKNSKAKTSLIENKELAFLSKRLAMICTNCETGFSLQDARIKNFYTKEAYEWFQKLEFKNMLNRFSDDKSENQIEQYYVKVTERSQAQTIFEQACTATRAALYVTGDSSFFCIGLCIANKQVYIMKPEGFMKAEYLLEQCKTLLHRNPFIGILDMREFLAFFSELSENYKVDNLLDVSLAAYLINPLQSSYDYEEIAKQYCGCYFKTRHELLQKKTMSEAIQEEAGQMVEYIGNVTYTIYSAMEPLMQQLEELHMMELYKNIEMPLSVTLYRMEQVGIEVRQDELEQYGHQLGERILKLQELIYELAGEEFNINSPKQLGEILFGKLKLPYAKKTKTGYSTSAEVLEKLQEEHEIVKKILEYRQLTKLKSTYADGLVHYIKEDRRIHSTFNQKVTATGRISSTEPNLQNIPIRMELGRLIRKVFVPREGFVFIDADYSQIELRVLAHLSGDEKLIDAYRKELDIHKITAAEVFHIPLQEVTSLQRRNAKAVNFGIVYGISSFGLSQDLSISRKEASEYIDKYFATYPKVKEFLDGLVAQAKKDGYVTSMFGRRRPVPELNSSNFMTRSFGERVAMNAPIQGTAADIIKIAMIRVDTKMQKKKLRSRLVLQVHDELLIETHQEEIEEVMKILTDEMHGAAQMAVPLEIDVHSGSNWYETK